MNFFFSVFLFSVCHWGDPSCPTFPEPPRPDCEIAVCIIPPDPPTPPTPPTPPPPPPPPQPSGKKTAITVIVTVVCTVAAIGVGFLIKFVYQYFRRRQDTPLLDDSNTEEGLPSSHAEQGPVQGPLGIPPLTDQDRYIPREPLAPYRPWSPVPYPTFPFPSNSPPAQITVETQEHLTGTRPKHSQPSANQAVNQLHHMHPPADSTTLIAQDDVGIATLPATGGAVDRDVSLPFFNRNRDAGSPPIVRKFKKFYSDAKARFSRGNE